MRDTSIFQGIKELNGIRFHELGHYWHVCEGNLFRGAIRKIKGESNKALYERWLLIDMLEELEELRDRN